MILRDWLNSVIQRLPIFVSAQDLAAGVKWSETVVDALRDATYGIVCVTSDNFDKPWLNFESGAIVNAVGRPRVAPLLLDLAPTDVVGPLSLFQMVSVEREGVFRLVSSINESLDDQAVPLNILARAYDLAWPSSEKAVGDLKQSSDPRSRKKPQARPVEDMVAEMLSILREERNRRQPQVSHLVTSSTPTPEFDRIPGVLSHVRARAENSGHKAHTGAFDYGMDLIVDDIVGIRIIGMEGAIYNRLRNHLSQLTSTMNAQKLRDTLVIFTREPDPDIRDFLASSSAQHGVGIAWTDGQRFYSDARARRVAPWLHDGNWAPERKRADVGAS